MSHRKNISCEKFLPMRGNFFCDRKFVTVTGIFFLWQKMFSCYRKILFAVRENFILWQQDSSCVKKFLPSDIKEMSKNHTPLSWFLEKNHKHLLRFYTRFFPLFRAKSFSGKLGSQEISNFLLPCPWQTFMSKVMALQR